MKQETTDWLTVDQREMDAIIAGLEIEMKDTKHDTGFYRWRPNEMQVRSAVKGYQYEPPKKRFRDSMLYGFLLVFSIGCCLYALAWLFTEILK